MNYRAIIQLARDHVGNGAAMESSARLCLSDAIACNDKGAFESAAMLAIKSLAYSVGITHKDYKDASKGRNQYGQSEVTQ